MGSCSRTEYGGGGSWQCSAVGLACSGDVFSLRGKVPSGPRLKVSMSHIRHDVVDDVIGIVTDQEVTVCWTLIQATSSCTRTMVRLRVTSVLVMRPN